MTSAKPPIVPAEDWATALEAVHRAEEELAEHGKRVAALRRRLPMTPVTGAYTFVAEEGECSLADIFGDARQLVVYHFMYGIDDESGCPHCTEFALHLGGEINDEISERDTRFVLMSRASHGKLAAWAKQNGIPHPWYSVPTAFSEEMGVICDGVNDYPGMTVFFKDDDGTVYRSWKASFAAIESVMPSMSMLRMTPWGMQEKGEDSPPGWPQRFDPL